MAMKTTLLFTTLYILYISIKINAFNVDTRRFPDLFDRSLGRFQRSMEKPGIDTVFLRFRNGWENFNTFFFFSGCLRACKKPNGHVCGSDGKTYGSSCSLRNAACLNPEKLIVRQCQGRCPCPSKNESKQKGQARNSFTMTKELFDGGQGEKPDDDEGLLDDDSEIENIYGK